MSEKKPVVLAWDVDVTLTEDTAWDADGCSSAEPRQEIIDLANLAHKSFFNVIHTARRSELYNETMLWLGKNAVRFQAVHFDKMASDVYIDDKAYNPNCPECMDKLNKIIKRGR